MVEESKKVVDNIKEIINRMMEEIRDVVNVIEGCECC